MSIGNKAVLPTWSDGRGGGGGGGGPGTWYSSQFGLTYRELLIALALHGSYASGRSHMIEPDSIVQKVDSLISILDNPNAT